MSVIDVCTLIGLLRVREENGAICECSLSGGRNDEHETPAPILMEAKRQLEAYFSGERCSFDLPISMRGTAFETAVWTALCGIPHGCTKSYAQIAEEIGRPGAARAVGRACGRNPLLVFVPCHRVIGANGALTGFAAGIPAKKALLSLEKYHQ